MRKLRLGELDAHIAGGSDREGGGSGPVVVLLHGFGAPATDLVPLWRQIDAPRDVRFVFPAAPHVLEPGLPDEIAGRAFWPVDIAALQAHAAAGRVHELIEREPEGLADARHALTTLVDALETDLGVPSSAVVIGGFSQGAMLACDFALRDPRPLAGLVILSGTIITMSEWAKRAPSRAGLPVLQSHGRSDPILPFEVALLLHRLLEDAGLDIEFVEFNGGHGVPPSVLDRLASFIARSVRSKP
jgi:phospholipase/carboxylesterase